MKIVYSDKVKLHNPAKEFISHNFIEYAESPDRMNVIMEALNWMNDVEFVQPDDFSLEHILKVHSKDYIEYLQTAYQNWVEAGLDKEGVMPDFFAVGNIRDKKNNTKSPIGLAGCYMTDLSTTIVEGSWTAMRTSANSAMTAAKFLINGERSAFSLGRPPGHHAGYQFCGGYCFLNNAALAARYLQDNSPDQSNGKPKVCILDVDYHHGNGTQDIALRQENMFYVSIHGHPDSAYPYLTGFEEENTENKALNFPLKGSIDNEAYFEVLKKAAEAIQKFNPQYLIISYGVDTHEFENDFLGDFKLTTAFYGKMAEYLRKTFEIPILVIMEGGYKISVLGANVTSFLEPLI